MRALHGAEGSELKYETLQDPVRNTLFQRNQVIWTLDLILKIAEAAFQPLSYMYMYKYLRSFQVLQVWLCSLHSLLPQGCGVVVLCERCFVEYGKAVPWLSEMGA